MSQVYVLNLGAVPTGTVCDSYLNLQKYVPLFQKQNITFEMVLGMDEVGGPARARSQS